jgi:hypothetical protein
LYLGLGRFDLRRRRLDLRLRREIVLHGVVKILLSDRVLLRERSVAVFVELRLALVRFGARQLRLGLLILRLGLCELAVRLRELPLRLIRCRLQRSRVDFEKELTLFDE